MKIRRHHEHESKSTKTGRKRIGVLAAIALLLCGPFSLRAENPMRLTLEKSRDGSSWQTVELTSDMLDAEGRIVMAGAPGTEFYRLRVGQGVSGPEGFARIPAGSFEMGDKVGDVIGGDVFSPGYPNPGNELPVHEVSVSGFFMEKHEVNKGLWDQVAAWAAVNGYDIRTTTAGGRAKDHPAYNLTWHECVKWCNARSEKDGLTPCYTVSGAVCRAGESDPECNFGANGYRLPTEAEWEYAARGGLSNRRFPWGDVISHSKANYLAGMQMDYETEGDVGYHPDYAGGLFFYTSPEGSFAANGYGIHDMTGNVHEWCWDRYSQSYYEESPAKDPPGPTGTNFQARTYRGGSWNGTAFDCRVAFRNGCQPTFKWHGFRTARSSALREP